MARVRAMARVRVRARVRVYGRTVGAALVDGELHVHGARRGTQQEEVVGEQLLDLGRDASPIVLDETVALGLAAMLPRLALEPAADHVAELLERLAGCKTRTASGCDGAQWRRANPNPNPDRNQGCKGGALVVRTGAHERVL